jgi:hypothetical protein
MRLAEAVVVESVNIAYDHLIRVSQNIIALM